VLDPSYTKSVFGFPLKFHEVFGAGHSFGAATVYQTAVEDRRIRGGLLLYDAYLLPIPEESLIQALNIPMVFINSETFKHRPYNETIPRMQKILKKEKQSLAVDLLGSEHQSQCDLVFFMPSEMYVMREIK
jgi:platelet-activating factor acetylhydrolase